MGDAYQTNTVEYNTPTTPQLQGIAINVSTAGDNTIIPAVAGKVIRVFRIFVVAPSSVNVTPKDGVAGTPFTGPLTIGSFVLDFDAEPWFTTSIGNAFVLNLSGAIQSSGRVYYTQV